jgi:hypothetical protein
VRPDQNRDGEADGDEVHTVEVHEWTPSVSCVTPIVTTATL